MPKFLKIIIFILLIIGSFTISHFSLAQEDYSLSQDKVYVCPLATKMDEVNPWCDCRIDLVLNETVTSTCPIDGKTYEMTLTITEYEGKGYYAILGFENGGAGENLAPVANANSPYQGYAGLPITFDASNSSDPNDDPLQYRWDFNNDGAWDTDWLNTPTAEYIWNDDYEGVVKLKVKDGQLTDIATSSIKIKSSRTFKEEAISELEAAKTGDIKTDKKIDKIIWLISQSLNENLWLNASHLVFLEKNFENFDEKKFEEMFDKPEWVGPKLGIAVFYYEKTAAGLMMNEIKKTPDELKNIFEEVIKKLVRADELLVKVSIFDAKNTPVKNPKFKKIVNREIEKAEQELEKAYQELEKNQPAKAIMRFAKAWLYSQLAIRFAFLK